MSEKPSDADNNTMPDDIATLYSRAQMQGTRYWDFSASRNEVRGQFRHRIVREQAERAVEMEAAKAPQFHVSQLHAAQIPFPAQPAARLAPAPVAPAPVAPTPVAPTPVPPPQVPSAQFSPAVPPQPVPPQPLPAQPRNGPLRMPDPLPMNAAPSTAPFVAPPAPPPVAPLVSPPHASPSQPPRWFALHSMFAPPEKASEAAGPVGLEGLEQRPPVLAVCSMAGGVGKTCLVATLGRALSGLGERVLLSDIAGCGLLPLYFGSRDLKSGLRTFSRPGAEDDVPVEVLNLQIDRYPSSGVEPVASGTPGGPPAAVYDPMLGDLLRSGRGAARILVDVATSNREATSRLLRLQPAFLVPLLPDMSSMAVLGSLEALLSGSNAFYVLNQFDVTSPLHLEMREMLHRLLGDRLLPFVLRRSPAFAEALAEGMTVIDYAPGSTASEDYWSLAVWLRNLAAPSVAGYGGVRWSER